MTAMPEDTIAAIATGPGGAISIIRISGPHADAVACELWSTRLPPARELTLGQLKDRTGRILDQAMMVRMPAPRSYTGEDCVEFHCHGGALVTRSILAAVLAAGARHAEPGEFTRRAFINGKVDLTQAEAVGDIIGARSRLALAAAGRQLDGCIGREVNGMIDDLTHILAETEVRLDFVDEDLDWQPDTAVIRALDNALARIDRLLSFRQEGEILQHGVRLAIAGPPNAGKSSLLNRMIGRDRAIVTAIAGTTRDTLEESIDIRGIPIQIVDTAGIRETIDVIEQFGVERSRAALRQARIVLWLYDATVPDDERPEPESEHLTGEGPTIIRVFNKIDALEAHGAPAGTVPVSAVTGDGLSALYDAIEAAVWAGSAHDEHDFAVSARHGAELQLAREALLACRLIIADSHYELLAIQLRTGLDHLARITGRTAELDILDTIFSSFCIGK